MKISLAPSWPRALALWRQYGRTDVIEKYIRMGEPVPVECRDTLCDIIAGRAKRPRGNPGHPDFRRTIRDQNIKFKYQLLRDDGVPALDAKLALAARFDLSEDTIDTIVRGIKPIKA